MDGATDKLDQAKTDMEAKKGEMSVEAKKAMEQANAERDRVLKEYGTKVDKTEEEMKRIDSSSREELMKLPPVDRKEAMQVKAAQELAASKAKLESANKRISAAKDELKQAEADGSMTVEEMEAKRTRIMRYLL